MTDQQFADGMSCAQGTRWLHTPNMDALAASGVRFTRAYSANPLCVPMRTAMMTAQYPHTTGVLTNDQTPIDGAPYPLLGRTLRDAGYATGYFGKWHVPMKPGACGFDTVDLKADLDPAPAAAFIRADHGSPFFAVASFNGPHEVCEWSRRQDIPGGPLAEPPSLDACPPMPPNFDPPANETDTIAHMRRAYQAHRLFPVGGYTEADWRRLIWGYYRLIERVDGFIGGVLDALRESRKLDHTVVLFLADHGDCHGAHRWNQKTVFYDESARVPFILSWNGRTPPGVSDHLVNNALDVLPTLCGFAGVEAPPNAPGVNLAPLALGDADPLALGGADAMPPRPYVVSENHMVQCEPVDGRHWTPQGRMVRSDRYKYCVYSEGTRRESLVDMEADPGEMVNCAGDPALRDVLHRHRGYLRDHAQRTGDTAAAGMVE